MILDYERSLVPPTHQFDVIANILYMVALAFDGQIDDFCEEALPCMRRDLETFFEEVDGKYLRVYLLKVAVDHSPDKKLPLQLHEFIGEIRFDINKVSEHLRKLFLIGG